MRGTIRAEFRKVFTIRSTYVILLLCLALEVLFAFYGDGIKASAMLLHDPASAANETIQATSALATLVALVGTLLVTHEYRYNTILYSLTATNRRAKLLFSKFLVMSVFSIVTIAIFAALAPVMFELGVHVKGLHLVHQTFPWGDLIWRNLFVGWGFSMLGLILAFIIRIQAGAFAALFLIQGTIEQLLGLILKNNQVYLPFSSLHNVGSIDHTNLLSYGHAALVALAWIVGGWIITWYLFLHRDAN